MSHPVYLRALEFAEASYSPTLPAPLRSTYKGCGPYVDPKLRSSHEPSFALAGLSGLGLLAEATSQEPLIKSGGLRASQVVGLVISGVGAGAAGYHGYLRSGGSKASAAGWAVLGALFPIITIPVAAIQGFGKRKRR